MIRVSPKLKQAAFQSYDSSFMTLDDPEAAILESERQYHEKLYSGFAQTHFSRPAVRRFRAHHAARIASKTGLGATTRVLSLGCGIADTELLLAPLAREIVGVDVSAAAIRQARSDARRLGVDNASFYEGTLDELQEPFDVILGIFFLHHLSDGALARLPGKVFQILRPGGRFYSLDPSSSRMSGKFGRLIVPQLMKRYTTENERVLSALHTLARFSEVGFDAKYDFYDFISTPLAGLFPNWPVAFSAARRLDDLLLQIPTVRPLGSNFEIVAIRPVAQRV